MSEVIALLCALEWTGKLGSCHTAVCTDSAAALMALQSSRPCARPDLIFEICAALRRADDVGLSVVFMWVPGHVGILGNEVADSTAKNGLSQCSIRVSTIGFSEYCCVVARKMTLKWQREWDTERRGRHF